MGAESKRLRCFVDNGPISSVQSGLALPSRVGQNQGHNLIVGPAQGRHHVPEISLLVHFGLHPSLGPRRQAPDVNKAGGGTMIEDIPLVVGSQTVVVKRIG
jgi:hypothetical protein